MNPTVRKFPWTVGAGLLLLTVGLGVVFLLVKADAHSAHEETLPVYAQVADFSLTNQDGAAASLADLRGRVWIADIIFTRCPGPCLRMTRQMKELQDALPKEAQTKLISLTTDPDYDTPAILKLYGERNGADPSRWTFLTGTKQEIGNLATGSLKLSAVAIKPEDRASATDLWVHSTIFVLVDKRGQLRGIYQTGGDDVNWPAEKQKILEAAKELERGS
jgi:protein SCO1/2